MTADSGDVCVADSRVWSPGPGYQGRAQPGVSGKTSSQVSDMLRREQLAGRKYVQNSAHVHLVILDTLLVLKVCVPPV